MKFVPFTARVKPGDPAWTPVTLRDEICGPWVTVRVTATVVVLRLIVLVTVRVSLYVPTAIPLRSTTMGCNL